MNTDDRSAFGHAVANVTRLYRRVFDRRAVELELTRAQWRALSRIHRSPGASQAQLAEDLDLEPIAVGRVIDRLQAAGFVERRADAADRRCWRLYPAAKSTDVMTRMKRLANGLHAEALQGVDAAELDTALRVLERVRATLAGLDRDGRALRPKGTRK
jgi:DNA-binding MarR family transcriptional regulator